MHLELMETGQGLFCALFDHKPGTSMDDERYNLIFFLGDGAKVGGGGGGAIPSHHLRIVLPLLTKPQS